MKNNRPSAPEATSPWGESILPGRAFTPPVVPRLPTLAEPPQPAPAAMAPVVAASEYPAVAPGYPAGAPGFPAGASFDPNYAAPGQFGGPQLPPQQFAPPQQFGAQAQLAPLPHSGNGRRGHRERAGTSRTTMLLVVAVVLALAGGGYYEAPKLLGSKKAPAAAPVTHHVSTPRAVVPDAAVPSAAVPGAVVPGATVSGAAVPCAAAPTAAGCANTTRGVTLPAALNGMPKLTDPASIAAATAFLASTADNLDAFKENSSAALYRLNSTTVVTVAATVNPDVGSDFASIDHAFAAFLLPGSADLKPTPVVGAASPAWIECKTFTTLRNGGDNSNAKPATTCGYVSAAVFAAIVVPSPRGADETAVATAIGRQLR